VAGSTLSPCPKPAVRSLQTLHAAGNAALDLGLFRDFQRIIDFDAQIPDGTFQLGMSEQQLDRPQILCSLVNQRRLGSAHRVRAVDRGIKANGGNPLMHDSSVLSRGHMR